MAKVEGRTGTGEGKEKADGVTFEIDSLEEMCDLMCDNRVPDNDLISRQHLINVIWKIRKSQQMLDDTQRADLVMHGLYLAEKVVEELPSVQPEEVIPHRNYNYLSDYWCECGWHLGKKGEVKYCSDCGRKVNWDE